MWAAYPVGSALAGVAAQATTSARIVAENAAQVGDDLKLRGAHALPAKDSVKVKAMAGVTASVVASMTLQPLDLVKTLLQDPYWPHNGIINSGYQMMRGHGVSSLWRGCGATLVRIVPGSAMYFCMVEGTSDTLKKWNGGSLPFWVNSVLGSGARATVALIMSPVTLVKTRMEAAGYGEYRNTFHALYKIAKTEKIRGLYSGVGATVLRDAPYSGLYYGFYQAMKSVLAAAPVFDEQKNHTMMHITASSTAGLLAALVTHPADVVKTRVQVRRPSLEGALHKHKTWHSWHTARLIFHNEGFRAFFVGLAPRLSKRVLSATITWTLYEEIHTFIKNLQDERDG